MLEAHPNSSGLFDVKHDRGGIIDVEFIVQYLILGHACDYPWVNEKYRQYRVTEAGREVGPCSALKQRERALIAYREFRRVQHSVAVERRFGSDWVLLPLIANHKNSRASKQMRFEISIIAVLRLWEEVFGAQTRHCIPDKLVILSHSAYR